MAQTPRVLIVEDDSRMADTLASMIKLMGYETFVANNSRQALMTAMNESPSIILLDLNLPGMDGFEVCRYLKREPLLADVPVVIVSADNSSESIEKSKEVGAVLYLVKPVGLDDLETAIATVSR